jgi:hypothetical protein
MQSVTGRGSLLGRIINGKPETEKMRAYHVFSNVPDGQEYCGDACRDAGSEYVEIACQCDHLACPLTFI